MLHFVMLVVMLVVALLFPVTASAAVFTWNPNAESDMSHYRLYECPSTENPCVGGVQVGPNVSHPTTTLTIPDPASTKNYSLSATDAAGNQSGRSNTVTKTIMATTQILTDSQGTWERFPNGNLTLNGTLITQISNLLRLCNGQVDTQTNDTFNWFHYTASTNSWAQVPSVCDETPGAPTGLAVQ